MSPNRNFIKTEISAELKCHHKSNVNKNQMSPKLKCLQTKMLQEPNFIKTRRSALTALALFYLVSQKWDFFICILLCLRLNYVTL